MRFSRLLSLIERPGDTILVSINETCQSIVHEVWQYGTEIAQMTSIIALGLVNKTAAEKNLELSQRIGPPKRPGTFPADSPFVSLLHKFNSSKNVNEQSPESKQIIKSSKSRDNFKDIEIIEEEENIDNTTVNKENSIDSEEDKENIKQETQENTRKPEEQINIDQTNHLHHSLLLKNNHLRHVQPNIRNFQTKSYDNIMDLMKTDEPKNKFKKSKEDRSDELLLSPVQKLKKKDRKKNFKKLRIKNSYFPIEKSQDDPFGQWHCASTTPYSSPTLSKAKNTPINFNDITNSINSKKNDHLKEQLNFDHNENDNNNHDQKESNKESSVKKEQENIIKANKVATILEVEKLKDEESANYVVNKTTGLFEDLRIAILLFIDYFINGIRSVWHSIFLLISSISISILFPFYIARKTLSFIIFSIKSANWIIRWVLNALFQPKKAFLRSAGFDQRTKEQIVKDSGYPYKSYEVVTEDGYIITLERLPNPKSREVVYFQHGVIDSGFTWIASGATSSIALAAYDHGFDVFLGNFRGNKPINHLDHNISTAKYWNFSVNEHAFLDMPAFINKIRKIKEAELDSSIPENSKEKYRISAISHSMGGMATLMYIIKSNLDQTPHYLSNAVLMSPAGIHLDTPKIIRFLAPILDWAIYFVPWVHSLSYPSDLVRVIMTKIMQDVKNSSPTRDLFTYFITKVIGGNLDDEHSLFKVNAIQWVFDGTPIGVFRHFLQLISSREFKSYDYGRKKNMQIYSSPEPINFLKNYHKIDIPIFFMMGLLDTLIPPANIMAHYSNLASVHPHLAYLKVFPKAGHVDFTLGMDEEMTYEILSVLKAKLDNTSN